MVPPSTTCEHISHGTKKGEKSLWHNGGLTIDGALEVWVKTFQLFQWIGFSPPTTENRSLLWAEGGGQHTSCGTGGRKFSKDAIVCSEKKEVFTHQRHASVNAFGDYVFAFLSSHTWAEGEREKNTCKYCTKVRIIQLCYYCAPSCCPIKLNVCSPS